jgi:hypothetical protein
MSVHALLLTSGPGCPTFFVLPSDTSGPGTDIITENSVCIGTGIIAGCTITTVDHRSKENCNGAAPFIF